MYISGIWKFHAVDSKASDLEKYSAQIIIQKTALPSSVEFDSGFLSTCDLVSPQSLIGNPGPQLPFGIRTSLNLKKLICTQ